MRVLYYLSLVALLFLVSCKKDAADGSSVKSFQESINDMATSLNTLQQTKFNEALYVLKTFAVEGETDMQKLEALAKLINTKKVPEIFSMADEVARKNNVDWSSTAPPSLGEMNIFQNIAATEVDPNDIHASSLDILVKPIEIDSVLGAKSLRIIPKLLDNSGKEVQFANAGLETTMEVYSNGVRLSTSKNLMTNNDFKGFYLKMSSLPMDKIVDSKIDIKIRVKTTKKVYQFLKIGVPINEKVLVPIVADEVIEGQETDSSPEGSPAEKPVPSSGEKPETTVSKFLNNLNNQNLKAAYEISDNPNWGSFDKFSNPTSGFGAVKNISVKNISTKSSSEKNAIVVANYQVEDRDGNLTSLLVTYSLKNTDTGWKISNYKINSSEKK